MASHEIFGLILLLALCGLAVAILLQARQARRGGGAVQPALKEELDRLEGRLRAEFATGRREAAEGGKELRQEVTVAVQELSRTLQGLVTALGEGQRQQFQAFSAELAKLREALLQAAQEQRREQAAGLKSAHDSTLQALGVMGAQQKQQLDLLRTQVGELIKVNETKLGELTAATAAKLGELGQNNDRKLEGLRALLDAKLETLRQAVGEQLDRVRQENAVKLEEMRKTVDEKLHETLEKRLGESFKQVSERLEQVHKGLGEMQTLAIGVGDLKKVLANVKVRGTWGEIQLGNLLEQMLTPEQYVAHAQPRPRSAEVVEFAIKLPGREEGEKPVLLPIDAKFPKEDYERLVEAADRGDPAGVEAAVKQLEARIKQEARDIRDKYIEPPYTTDFAILYLPIEGLYAEVLRRPGLADTLQRDFRVTVAGPTTLAALLNSLQMGFRTLAIQKRSSEVWKVLGAVKKKFESFGETFAKVQKKIHEADKALEEAQADTRIMGKKLRAVEALPEAEARLVLAQPAAGAAASPEAGDDAEADDARPA
ncbi:MAG: DNA recombination protein RmuC [Lentisphaeria bacterium]|jgi:DNA recombination protein RmuC